MKILGIDPALGSTGWGIIESNGNHLSFVAGGTVRTNAKDAPCHRLQTIHDELQKVMQAHSPDSAAVEETFVNSNARTSLKLGQARGISLLVPALHGLEVGEYSPLEIKKSVVGYGRAEKEQVQHMVKTLLPTAVFATHDTADALAVAICHAHMWKIKMLYKSN